MNPEIEKLEAAIAAANEKLAELKAAEAAQVEKPWPQIGADYWSADSIGVPFCCSWQGDEADAAAQSIGNVFRTKKATEQEVERRKVLIELRRLARESWGGEKPDWSSRDQDKWYLDYDHLEERWETGPRKNCQDQGVVYFATCEAALAAIGTIGAERLMLLLED